MTSGFVFRGLVLDGSRFLQCLLRRLLVRLGLIGQVFGDEKVRDFLFLRGEGPELGDALELFAGEGRLWGQRRGVAGEVAGGAGVEGDEAGGGELLEGGPGGLVEDLELRGMAAPVGFVEELRNPGGASGEMEDGIGGRGVPFGGLVRGRVAQELLEPGEVGIGTALEFGATRRTPPVPWPRSRGGGRTLEATAGRQSD